MMIIINKVGSQAGGFVLTGSYGGKGFGVAFDESKYNKMLELQTAAEEASDMETLKQIFADFEPLTVESYKELIETATPYLLVNKTTNKFYLKWQNESSSIALPKALVDRILDSLDKKTDPLPLVKFWVRTLRNPFFSDAKAKRLANYVNKTYTNQELVTKLVNDEGISVEAAVLRATTTQVSITREGLLVGYKVAKEIDWKFVLDADGNKKKVSRYEQEIDDISGVITYKKPEFVEDMVFEPAVQGQRGDAFYCGGKLGHIYKVGNHIALPNWSMVNTNDSQSCVPGLHVGGLDYIRGYQHENTVTHNVFIDPMHIGAITDDGSGALRVKEMFIHSSFAGVNRGIYHSSAYAAITDQQFDAMVEDIVEKTREGQIDLDQKMIEKKALKM